MSFQNNDRINSEKKFHNARFSSELNLFTKSRYYFALDYWYRDYFVSIENLCAKNILEIGSGIESLALQLTGDNFNFDSIDISEEAIAYAEKNTRLLQAKFSVGDAHQMTFPPENFDLVIGRGILHHLDIPLACSEIKRVLKPNGKIVFGEPLNCNFFINIYRRFTPQIRSRDERPLSRKELSFLRTKFSNLDIRYYGFLTLVPAVFGFRSSRFLHWLDGLLLNKFKLGPYLAWACLIRTSAHNIL